MLLWFESVGLCLGMAIGTHPTAVFFAAATVFSVIVFMPTGQWLRVFAAMALGVAIPAALVLLCWSGDLAGSIEQFLWSCNEGLRGSMLAHLRELLTDRSCTSWAHYWHMALALVSFGLVPVAAGTVIGHRRADEKSRIETGAAIAVLFTVAGLFACVRSLWLERYYLLYFTIWPVVALSKYWDLAEQHGRRLRLFRALVAVLLVCWLPSFFWNVMRFRETILWHSILDKKPLVAELAKRIPPGAAVEGDLEFFVIARKAGLDYTPMPCFYTPLPPGYNGPGIKAPRGAWLLVSDGSAEVLNNSDPGWQLGRKPCFKGKAFAGSQYTEMNYYIYGPAVGGQ